MEACLDREALELADRVVGQRVVALELGLERLEGVDDVGAGAVPELGLGGREGEVHAAAVWAGAPPRPRRDGRGARDSDHGRGRGRPRRGR